MMVNLGTIMENFVNNYYVILTIKGKFLQGVVSCIQKSLRY